MARTKATEAKGGAYERDPDVQGADPNAPATDGVVRFDTTVIGQTGLRHTGGWVDEEYLRELRGPRARRVYQEMSDNCPVVGALLFAMQALFRSVEWSVQAADDSAKSEKGATFLEEVLDDMEMPIESVMTEVATMFPFGFSVHEVLWKKRVGPDETDPTKRSRFEDNKIGLRGLPGRAQSTIYRWEIDPATGDIKGVWQQPISGHLLFIPMEKLLLFRTTEAKNNPEGRSILRNAYRPWYFKRRIEEIEAIGVERDAAGLPVIRIPSAYMAHDADPADKALFEAYKGLARGIKRDNNDGIVLPSDVGKDGKPLFGLELLSTAGSRTIDTTKVLERYDRQIAMSVLADFIFLGQSAVGSFALSSDKTALFGQALGAFLANVASVFNRVLIPALWKVNNLPNDTMPKLVFEDVERPNLAELSSYVTSLAGAGMAMFPDRELENKLREMGGLPPAPEEGTDDYALQRGAQPGMTLGPDGKPIPSTAREDAKTQADHERSQPPGMPQQWSPGQPGAGKADDDKNGVPDEEEAK